ncbi:tautomerase family protein [Marinobacterium mangrovicola]|uniref:Tautomerase-like protein n=1 Tax=Marinobacterium mangrovicola TaxID=1476959 RepID=A0A4R1GBM1_9GAMM|nr:tautomerase family protein [Marinobacterium mangrovicola]TCK04121.1 tautomerase-like protein [Marinobacterium mangrovicola]
MPLTRIALPAGRSADFRHQVSVILQQTLEKTFAVPPGDCFQLFDEYPPGMRVLEPDYLSSGRSENCLIFQISAGRPRTAQQKKALYQTLCGRLNRELGINTADVMILIKFNQAEDWSFSEGRALTEETT